MSQLKVFNSVSLDGYFCGDDGDMAWAHEGADDPEWQAFAEANARGGGLLVFGRITYEMMASYWPTAAAARNDPVFAERMNSCPKRVFSRTLEKAAWQNTTVLRGNVASELERLKRESESDMVLLGSGSIVSEAARAGLIDELQLVVCPIVLGRGRTLFQTVTDPLRFVPKRTRAFENGKIFTSYEPRR